MINRYEYWGGILIVAGILIYTSYSTNTTLLDIQKARIETRDSMLIIQRDSAINMAKRSELKTDSFKTVIERRDNYFKNNKAKNETEKKIIRSLNADSSLQFFLQSTH